MFLSEFSNAALGYFSDRSNPVISVSERTVPSATAPLAGKQPRLLIKKFRSLKMIYAE
jgi:hypothetical protein